MNENYPAAKMTHAMEAQAGRILGGTPVNPTLRENINARIQHYREEIVRLDENRDAVRWLADPAEQTGRGSRNALRLDDRAVNGTSFDRGVLQCRTGG